MADKSTKLWFLQCVILFFVFPPTLQSTAPPFYEICSAANFDVRNLTTKLWQFSMPSEFCLSPSTGVTPEDEDCVVTLAFCRYVNLTQACSQAAVCQAFPSSNLSYSLATYQLGQNPFNTAAVVPGQGFSMRYEGGGNYSSPDNSSCTLHTVMTFLCSPQTVWDDEDETGDILTVPRPPIIHFTQQDNRCIYTLTFEFAGACPVFSAGVRGLQLSVGSVLLLIFAVTAVLYFTVGSVVRGVRGGSSQGVLPHHHFWAYLPGYIKDGVVFTVTCGTSSGTQGYESI